MVERFIQTAINLQDTSANTEHSKRMFKTSCNICSSRGIKINCNQCPIKAHHELVVAVFQDMKEYDEMKKEQACLQ